MIGVVLCCLATWYLAIALPWFVISNLDPLQWLFLHGSLPNRWSNDRWDFHPLVPFEYITHEDPWNSALVPGIWFAFATVQWTLMPLCFLLLPMSMQKAKVRRVHLYRAAAYSVGWWLLTLHLSAIMIWLVVVEEFVLRQLGLSLAFVTTFYYDPVKLPWLIGVHALVLSATWWSAVSSRYLKLPRPALIGAVLAILATLFTTLVVGLIGGGTELVMSTV